MDNPIGKLFKNKHPKDMFADHIYPIAIRDRMHQPYADTIYNVIEIWTDVSIPNRISTFSTSEINRYYQLVEDE